MTPTLHYILDPLCGWCYAAEPLALALQERGIALEWHAGGLFDPQIMPAGMRAYVRQADARVAQLSGQPYGEAYLNGLLNRPDTRLDSLPPVAALLAAEQLSPGHGLRMQHAIQHGRYEQGLEVVDAVVLKDLAISIGLDGEAFASALAQQLQGPAQAHIRQTRTLMQNAGVQGFPGFVLRRPQGLQVLQHSNFYGRTAEWVQDVQALLGQA
nr:DsbA family protein [uncultured Rhodoferax sp.]